MTNSHHDDKFRTTAAITVTAIVELTEAEDDMSCQRNHLPKMQLLQQWRHQQPPPPPLQQHHVPSHYHHHHHHHHHHDQHHNQQWHHHHDNHGHNNISTILCRKIKYVMQQ
jgi:hypothetical protein